AKAVRRAPSASDSCATGVTTIETAMRMEMTAARIRGSHWRLRVTATHYLYLYPMAEEPRESLVERLRLLEVGQVPCGWNDRQPGAGDCAVHLFGRRRRGHRVLRAHHDQRREVDRLEQRRRVWTRHQCANRAGDRVHRIRQYE